MVRRAGVQVQGKRKFGWHLALQPASSVGWPMHGLHVFAACKGLRLSAQQSAQQPAPTSRRMPRKTGNFNGWRARAHRRRQLSIASYVRLRVYSVVPLHTKKNLTNLRALDHRISQKIIFSSPYSFSPSNYVLSPQQFSLSI